MNYYRIFRSANSKQIGKYPQVYEAEVPTTVTDANYIVNLQFEKASDDTQLPKGILAAKAKKTDLISATFIGFSSKLFISKKLFEILHNSKFQGVQFLKTALIIQNKGEEEYYIVNPYELHYEYLDFNSSLFNYYPSSFSPVEKQVYFNNVSELITGFKQLVTGQIIRIETPVFIQDCDVDFFPLNWVNDGFTGYFVSERLKDEIETAGCTGIVFTNPGERYP